MQSGPPRTSSPPEDREEAHAWWIAWAGLAAVVAWLFRDVLFRGQYFYYRDLHLQWHTQVEAFVRCLAAGSWPVWNPYVSFGQPLWANPNNEVLYPFTWLHVAVRPWTYYTLFVVAHALFTGWGMLRLGRRLGLSALPAWTAAVLWVASGPFLSLVSLWNHLAGASWLPWIVAAGDETLARCRVRSAIFWAVTLAAPVLAGSFEMTVFGGAASVVLASGHLREGIRRRLALTAAAVLLAVGLSAGQWVPTLDITRRSARQDLPADVRTFWSVPPLLLGQTLLPVFVADLPLQREVRADLFEGREPFLSSMYVGITTLPLVLAAFLLGRRRLRWELLVLLVLSVAYALGRFTPAYGWMAAAFPPLRMVRYPAKAMIVASLAWSLLVALGCEAWSTSARRVEWKWAAFLLAPSLLLGLVAGLLASLLHRGAAGWGSILLAAEQTSRTFGQLLAPSVENLAVAGVLSVGAFLASGHPRWRASRAVLVGLVVLDLLWFHRSITPTGPREIYAWRPPAAVRLLAEKVSRVYVYDYFYEGRSVFYLRHRTPYMLRGRREDYPFPWVEAVSLRAALFPSVIGVWGFETAYHQDPVDLYSRELETLTHLVRSVEGSPAELRLLRMGAVSHVLSLHRKGFEDLRLVEALPNLFIEQLNLLAVPDPLPRVYVVGGLLPSQSSPVAALLSPSFDPAREVVTEGAARVAPADFRGQATVVRRTPDRVVLTAELSHPGHLVLVDTFDPGWKVTVDGRAGVVVPVNLAFQGVALGPGRHQVEMVYRPRSIFVGLALSASAALLAAGLYRRARREE